MKTVAIDARKYFDYGIGTYIQQLIFHLSHFESSLNFRAYVSSDDAQRIKLPASWQRSIVSYGKYSVGEILFLGLKSIRDGATIFHSPHYTLPFGLRGRSVVTIHDLIPLRFPQYFNVIQRTYARQMMSRAVIEAGYVIVDSQFTKKEILGTFRVNEKKIVVIHLGAGGDFKPVKSIAKKKAFRKMFGLRRPFILFVGNTKPHKGIAVLLEAFSRLKNSDIELVFAGEKPLRNEMYLNISKALGIEKRIREIGRISPEDLVIAYNTAEILALPSFYEGFGLPVLEAMACGTPVVSSDAGSIPEVAGNAALIVPRDNPGAFAEALDSVLHDSGLRKNLIEKGNRNVKRFSWEKMAKKTLEVYQKLI